MSVVLLANESITMCAEAGNSNRNGTKAQK